MQRERKDRVHGPYPHGNRWRVVLIGQDGTRGVESFETEAEATAWAEDARGEASGTVTVKQAVAQHIASMAERGLKYGTYARAEDHLERLLQLEQHGGRPLSWLRGRGAELYAAAQVGAAVDSHRNALAAGRAFGKWCVKQRLLPRNPFAEVDGVGRRRAGRGKVHLRIDEGRELMDYLLEAWDWTAAGAHCHRPAEVAAVLAVLLLGTRATELVVRDVRDLDAGGTLLWIPDAKTENGRRTLEIPEVLQPLLRELARGRIGAAPLFTRRDGTRPTRAWLYYQCRALCAAAGVPPIGPQAFRRSHGTIARRGGATGELVAAQLGHGSVGVQERSYVAPGAAQAGETTAVLRVLQGGRS